MSWRGGSPSLHPGSSLHQALGVLAGHEGSGLPVLSADDRRIIGWLNHRDVLRAYSARLRTGAQQAAAAAPVSVATRASRRRQPQPAPGNAADNLGRFRLLDLELTDTQPPVGLTVTQVAWPPSSHLLALRRDGETIPVAAQTVLAKGDRLTLLVAAEYADGAAERCAGAASRALAGADDG